jgi:biopolymer transport protein ExbD
MAADVGGGDSGKKKGKKGRKKKSNPRIDMTPMVDLGFLLLTFFVLTTTMSTPTTMPVVVPEDDTTKVVDKKDEIKLPEGKVLNLLISGKNRIFYYQGVENVELSMTNYSPNGLRPILQDYQKKVAERYRSEKDPLVVIVKMTKDATFKNWVDIIDEMNITNQKKYVLIDITPDEVDFIKGYEASQNLPSSLEKSVAGGTATDKKSD